MKRGEIIDAIGKLDEEIAKMQARRAKLVARLNTEGNYEGNEFKASVYQRTNTWLSVSKVKRRLGADKLAACYDSNTSLMVRITKLAS